MSEERGKSCVFFLCVSESGHRELIQSSSLNKMLAQISAEIKTKEISLQSFMILIQTSLLCSMIQEEKKNL